MTILSTILAVNFDQNSNGKLRPEARDLYLDPNNYRIVHSTRHDDGSITMQVMLRNGQVVATQHDNANKVNSNTHLLCDNQFALFEHTPLFEVDCIHNRHVPITEFEALVNAYVERIREHFHA